MNTPFSCNLQEALTNWTVQNSGYENHRSYIGLSGIADCDRMIYDRFRHGVKPNGINGHLLTRISYELEGDLIRRLTALKLYKPAEDICLYDGLVCGHPDGIVGHDLLEIKTVAEETHFPQQGRLPRRIYWQVQAYLHFTKLKAVQVVYLARANGALGVIMTRYNPSVAMEIVDKIDRLVKAVKSYQRPDCTCGRCEVKA